MLPVVLVMDICMTAEHRAGLAILAFASADAWDAWLEEQPRASPGLWLKLAKKGAARASVGRQEAIDTALRHGWIDGRLDPYDDLWWLIRFTPRKAKSRWSANNRAKALALIAEGRMRPAGLVEVEAAQADGRWDAAYPSQSAAEVPADLQAALDAVPAAKAFFAQLTGANRYAILYRVHEAKTVKTRAQRVAKFVAMLERGETVHPQR